MVFRLVYIWEDGERQCVCFSEEFFESFSWDPPYRERFAFLTGVDGEIRLTRELGPASEVKVEGELGLVWEFRLEGELGLRVEGLLRELRELREMKEGMAAELEKLVLLRLLFVLEEGKTYLTAGY